MKTNPFGIFTNSPNLALEYRFDESLSIELDAKIDYGAKVGPGNAPGENSRSKSGHNLSLAGKYFFRPKKGNDRFYFGLYFGQRNRTLFIKSNSSEKWIQTSLYAGLTGGLKWIGASGIVIDLSAGYGRAIRYNTRGDSLKNSGVEVHAINFNSNGSDAFVKIGIGYRFPKREEETEEEK